MYGKNFFNIIQDTTAFNFLIKLFSFKNEASLILTSFLSLGLTFSTNEIFGAVLKNTDLKHLIVPLFVEIGGFTIYFLFNIVDFCAGLWFAVYNAKKMSLQTYFEQEKLYKTLWKMLGVLLLSMLLCFIAVLSEILGAVYSYKFFTFAIIFVLSLASLWEFQSIGKNIEKRTGSKPEIFGFMDRVLIAIQKRALKKIENEEEFKNPEPEPEPEKTTEEKIEN